MARRFAPNSRVKRLTDWASTAPETGLISLPAATAIIDSTFVTSTGAPETLVRSVGELMIKLDQQAVNESPFGAFGICVVSDEAAAIGVTAVPTPYTDSDSDSWLLHQFWAASMQFASGVGVWVQQQRYSLNSRAMRKLHGEETLLLVIENGHAINGASYRLDMRLLAKVT